MIRPISKSIEVLGSRLHYLEAGSGMPILFLHSIPTSSYVWREIIPYLAPLGHCIAPDLIGFGLSDHPDIQYSIKDHIRYIETFIKTLKLKNIIFVMQGLGTVIGLDYAMRHPSHCRGLVFYEAFLRSLDEVEPSLPLHEQLLFFREEKNMQSLLSQGAASVKKLINSMAINPLPGEILAAYCQPFQQAESTRALVQYIKELSLPVEKEGLENIINTYTHKLMSSSLPKLMLYSVPGFITTMSMVMWAKHHLSHLEVVDLGEELHLIQESHPQLMGEAISVWIQALEERS